MIVRADIKFGLYTDFLDRTLAAEDNRLPNESIEDGVIRVHEALERAAAILKKKIADSNTPEIIRSFTPQQTGPSVAVIDYKEKENLEIAIDNATSLTDLVGIKDECWKHNLSQQYIIKFNELNNGSHPDFVAGLE
jgi:hypothetical protein